MRDPQENLNTLMIDLNKVDPSVVMVVEDKETVQKRKGR